MHQLLHLLIVDQDGDDALATWTRSRWTLPVLSTSERVRAGGAVVAWAARCGLQVHVLGQWLGRLAQNLELVDWLIVARCIGRTGPLPDSLRWSSLEHLTSSGSNIEYQQWAYVQCGSHDSVLSVPGSFGTLSWLKAVTTWVEEVAGEHVAPTIASYRAGAHEVVVGFSLRTQRVFFKGLSEGRACEALVTSALAELLPGAFAPTLAIARRADGAVWWLIGECPGRPLAESISVEDSTRVVTAFARLRQATGSHLDDLMPHLTPIDVSALCAWGAHLLSSQGFNSHVKAVERAYAIVSSTDVPEGLVAVDLDPTNVFLRGRDVRFIDLDEPHYGHGPIAVSIFARRVARALADKRQAQEARRAIYDAYADAWSPRRRMRQHWAAFEIMSALLEARLGWQRVEEKVRGGELFGVTDHVRQRIALRLTRTLEAEREGGLT